MMVEQSETVIPAAHKYIPHVETGVMDHLTPINEAQRAAQEAERVSTNTTKREFVPTSEDNGIHRTQEDRWEEELKAAGWTAMTAHPRSAVWRSPDGVLMPGPGYAWSVMKAHKV